MIADAGMGINIMAALMQAIALVASLYLSRRAVYFWVWQSATTSFATLKALHQV